MVSVLTSVRQAQACIGTGESYAVAFKDGSKPDELIAVVSEKTSGKSQEILDDTGFVGLHLAVTSMVKQADASNASTILDSDPAIGFAKARLTALQRYIQAGVGGDARVELLMGMRGLDQALKESPVKKQSLEEGMQSLTAAFYKQKIEFLASTRADASQPFGEEVALSSLKLPTYLRFRSMGCNAGIASFNAIPAKASASSSAAPATRTSGPTTR